MRLLSISFLMIILGLAAGSALGLARLWLVPWTDETRLLSSDRPPAVAPPAGPQSPRVAVDSVSFDFGTQDADVPGEHTFRVTNVGGGPLHLNKGSTSCSCVIGELGQETLQPGESTAVVVQFKSKGLVGSYSQKVTLLTDDPASPQVVLAIHGRFTAALKVSPVELALGTISASDTVTHEVRLLCFTEEKFALVDPQLTDAATAGSFAVDWRALRTDEFADEPGVRSGALVRVTVKPGLPLGAFRQTIKVHTNLEKRSVVEIPVEGFVSSDLSIVGPGWNAEAGVLRLGIVPGSAGLRRTLLVMARGPHAKEVQLSAAQIKPELLRIEVGQPSPIGTRGATQTPLTIEVPKGSPPANFTGSEAGPLGEIILHTHHPQIPKLRVRVSFAIEG